MPAAPARDSEHYTFFSVDRTAEDHLESLPDGEWDECVYQAAKYLFSKTERARSFGLGIEKTFDTTSKEEQKERLVDHVGKHGRCSILYVLSYSFMSRTDMNDFLAELGLKVHQEESTAEPISWVVPV